MKSRRQFLTQIGATTGALAIAPQLGMAHFSTTANRREEPNVFGPREGYSETVGTLVSMMDWMRVTVVRSLRDLSVADLDHLIDDNANSIGAMLLHLAATERFYQLNTFDNREWGDWPKEDDKKYSVAMSLGDEGRKKIKGKPLDYYLEILAEVRENSLSMLKERDDEWLFYVDEDWFWGPTNNYCKWFHVVEHESNHNGQIKFLTSRLPSRNE